jgi:proteasome lid subunit RPN8/RPN11
MFNIKRQVVAEIEQHAQETAPLECCGLLAGREQVIEQLYRLRNIAAHPRTRYFADPQDLFRAQKLMRAHEERLLGIYHSHPASSAYPSETDIQQAYYPEAIYFIVSLEPKSELRGYLIRDGKVEEVEYQIVDG